MIALVVTSGALAAACENDADAPPPPPQVTCDDVDTRLAPVYALMDAGELDGVRGLLGDGLTPDERQDVVAALLAVVDAVPPGTFAALGGLAADLDDASELEHVLAQSLRWLADATRPPGSPETPDTAGPHHRALAAVRGLIATCEGPPALRLLSDLITEAPGGGPSLLDRLLSVVAGVLGDPDLAGLVEPDALDGPEAQGALRILVDNLLAALRHGTLDVAQLVGLLGVATDVDVAPWPEALAIADELLGQPERLEALEGLARCVDVVDPDGALIALVLDLALDDELALTDLLSGDGEDSPADEDPSVDEPTGGSPWLPAALSGPLTAILDMLADDRDTRDALSQVLRVGLSDPWAPRVMEDLATLLDAQVLADIVDLLGAIAGGGCPR